MERSIRGRLKTLMPAAQGLALGGQGDVAPFKPARPSPLWVVPEQVFLLVHAQFQRPERRTCGPPDEHSANHGVRAVRQSAWHDQMHDYAQRQIWLETGLPRNSGVHSTSDGIRQRWDPDGVGIVEVDVDAHRDGLSCAMARPVIVCDDTRTFICEQRPSARGPDAGVSGTLMGAGSVVLIQVQEPAKIRVVVTGEREEADKSAIAVSAETLRSRHIPVGLAGKESRTVIWEDDLDSPGRVLAFRGGRIPRNLLSVVVPLGTARTLGEHVHGSGLR